MFEIPADAPLIVIVLGVIVYIINSIYNFVGGIFQKDAQADKTAAAERQQWMTITQTMLTTVLDAQHNKYAGFTRDLQQHFDDVVTQVQDNFTAALGTLVETISQQMMPISEQREKKLDAIHADVRTVPGEVWRLGDPRLEGLSNSIRADLEPMIAGLQETLDDGFRHIEAGIAQRLDAMGEEISPAVRQMINAELQQYQRQTARQLDRLTRLVEALREDLVQRPEAEGTDNPAGVPNGTPAIENQQESGETATPSEPAKKREDAEGENHA